MQVTSTAAKQRIEDMKQENCSHDFFNTGQVIGKYWANLSIKPTVPGPWEETTERQYWKECKICKYRVPEHTTPLMVNKDGFETRIGGNRLKNKD